MKRLNECLNDNYGSYINPFFWQHGESHEEITEQIDAIRKSGAKEFCVESRVYEDFCGENWWIDFKFMLDEAKKRDMRVWLLDDKRFPTGFANGSVAEKSSLKKKHIRLEYIDVAGPKADNALLIKCIGENEKLISVTAYRRTQIEESVCGEGIDLTENIFDDLIFWDIPKGVWRIYFVIETRLVPERFKNHIDILNTESCNMQLKAVYETHYEHFKDYFGNTFAGFFSDEPSFGNDAGDYYSILGKNGMLLPWSDDIPCLLAEKMNAGERRVKNLLPLLWAVHSESMYHIRYAYMDVITIKYKENFSDMLGNWCREHGVMYIGHVIEDMNTHMRMGHGPGHFFRALSGQDMSGCDIVLNQIIPGIKECVHAANVYGYIADPEFFTYTLAKLASSDSHIHKQKYGRAFCEIFGAFGWAEGIPMMKQLADHMLVNGINHFVPHAFNAKYPDGDCPPHFYIDGKTPQFDSFCDLTVYMQRMSHILSGGVHIANVAVLYNAEAEWCGGEYELFQKISKTLTQNQLDFDFIPSDYLKNAEVINDSLHINDEYYKCLIVSYSEVLPKNLMDNLVSLCEKGLEIIFCKNMPKRYAELDKKPNSSGFTVIDNDNLPAHIECLGMRDIKLAKPFKYLRYYHIKRDSKDIFMFLNEDIFNGISAEIKMPCGGQYIKYNAWENSVTYKKTDANILKLNLAPSEATVIIFEEHNQACEPDIEYIDKELKTVWKIYTEQNSEYILFDETDKLYNLAKKIPKYCGKIKYECSVDFGKLPDVIELGNVGEIAKLSINEKQCTDSVAYPYRFDIKGKCKIGENKISVEVISNLAYRERDGFSRFLSLPPIGITGPVKLKFVEKGL